MIKEFLLPFITVGLSELGDKTQLAVISLSSKFRSRLVLFIAVMTAFVIIDGLAVVFGSVLVNMKIIPFGIIKIIAAVIFVAYGIYTIILSNDEGTELRGRFAFFSVVGLLIMLEMGDKSQIATVLFASEFNPLLVFLGVESALSILTLAAIFAGSIINKHVRKDVLKYVSGFLFVAVGVISLLF
ncbi:TMEM165/GDT1 family protein [Candidatus Woesearchaeota archaeon]|nr:TMEM165/GDT1 family protein [Candidatus Woesearchaeota archaeon]